jgi:hypothetical protein
MKAMSVRAAIVACVVAAVVAAPGYAGSKMDVCHRTGSEKNPTVMINVSVNASGGHYGGHDDAGGCGGYGEE